jgi:FAD/FMN-containing dehydrogenase
MSISEFVDKVQTQLPKDTLREVPESYLEEPRSLLKGSKNSILALPQSTKEVSTIVNFSRDTGVGIIPYSGGTGLVGGQVNPTSDPVVILSTSKMNKIRKIYPNERVVIVDAGLILDDLQKEVEKDDLFFPLSLASQGSCRIGGNLATNAGGVQVLKYGNIRDLCLGIEAVLPNGEVFNGLKRLRKDNTGYDIKNLLIGSEGTLGLITGASLRLFPKPNHVATAILSVRSPSIALELLNNAQEFLDERVSSFAKY